MTDRVAGKVAFITGAGRGQGRSHAVRLAQEGADIIAVDICEPVASVQYPMASKSDLDETAREVRALGRRIVTHAADVRDFDAIRQSIADGVAELGRLDIVVSNAGIGGHSPLATMPERMWQDMMDINLSGAWHVAKAAIPHLEQHGGSIIITSSSTALKPVANAGHYIAAKHGLTGLMRVLALELAQANIRVNCILPTSVNTPMIHNPSTYALFRPDVENPTREQVSEVFDTLNAQAVPWVDPIDISNGVLFLASDESRYVTGIELPIDAGYALK